MIKLDRNLNKMKNARVGLAALASFIFIPLSQASDAATVNIKNCNSQGQCLEVLTPQLGLSEFAPLSTFSRAIVRISFKGQVTKVYEALHGNIDFTSNKVTITMIDKIKIDRVIDLESFQEMNYANPW